MKSAGLTRLCSQQLQTHPGAVSGPWRRFRITSLSRSFSVASESRHQFEIRGDHLDRLIADRPEIAGERRPGAVDAFGHPHAIARQIPRLGAGRDEGALDRLGLADPVVEVGDADRRIDDHAVAQVELVVARLADPDRIALVGHLTC
jgi:hypothetical protein